jgi:hypothetical protein
MGFSPEESLLSVAAFLRSLTAMPNLPQPTKIRRESPPTCSSRTRTCGQGDSKGNFSDHSKIITAGAAKTSSNPKVSKS